MRPAPQPRFSPYRDAPSPRSTGDGPSLVLSATLPNIFTIDLEDWPIAVLGPHHAITERVVENTKRCLHLLRWHRIRATFFVLTKVAEQYPDLIREIHASGHEIASHGHGHVLLTRLTPRAFESDVIRSIEILEAITGRRPIGYRAPGFSIVESTRWAGSILAGLGFRYSSSIFPIRHPRYGIARSARGFHRWADCDLIECPPATLSCLGLRLPIAGGGYFRLFPGPLARAAVRRLNQSGKPAVLYMHPYELDVGGVTRHVAAGLSVSPWRWLTQSLFRSRFEPRLHRLFESFVFETLAESVARHGFLRSGPACSDAPCNSQSQPFERSPQPTKNELQQTRQRIRNHFADQVAQP